MGKGLGRFREALVFFYQLRNSFVVLPRQVSNEETLKLLHEDNMQNIDTNFCEFQFVPRSIEELQTPAAVVAVFHDLGLMEKWSINQETLSRLSIGRACGAY